MSLNLLSYIKLVLCLSLLGVPADGKFKGKKSQWKGFSKTEFKVGKYSAFVVQPNQVAEGKPWVWRARFPTYHTEIDEMLLKDGYHIAHINAGSRLGSIHALKIWEQFYDLLTQKHGLNQKVVLEGVSRGGLYVYRWAKNHPETVACIYNDTPVCDFKSWPGGKGQGKGAQGEWKRLLKEYGFKDEAEAMAYEDNPIDKLQPIVDARIPIMHIVTEDDQIVPPRENVSTTTWLTHSPSIYAAGSKTLSMSLLIQRKEGWPFLADPSRKPTGGECMYRNR